MAATHRLIAQVAAAALGARRQEEADALTRGRSFGLVFERHLPEVTTVCGVRAGGQEARGKALCGALTQCRSFGLAFERHLPEVTAISGVLAEG